jgi:drug/metabolite transporter (DMT)-like permease
MPRATTGVLLCLLSAGGFGAMAIFGKLAYGSGVSTMTLLLMRFSLGAALFGVVLAIRGFERPGRRAIWVGLGLGAIGYATQAGLFFAALRRLDASLLALVLYTYPAWVVLAGLALGRERPDRRRLAALALSSGGLFVVLATAAAGQFDAVGAIMGLGASFAYTAYILVADGAGVGASSLTVSVLVCLGATVTFAVAGGATGSLHFGFEAEGWLWLACIGVVSTALPIVAFFAGLDRVGASTASILSTFEPVVTVTLAFLAFGERLSTAQLGGAVLVLAAAVVLAAPTRSPEPVPPT